MCNSPILIPNPYYDGRNSDTSLSGEKLILSRARGSPIYNKFESFKNRADQYISVPCGKCQQCTSLRQSFLMQRVQMESIRSHLFFFTLTYNDLCYEVNLCGYNLLVPDYTDVINMFKRLRKKHSLRYWIVSEYGKKGRPHYHGILAIEKSDIPVSNLEQYWYNMLLSEWKVNVGDNFNPVYKPLLDFVRRGKKCTYDFHYIEPICNHDNDVSFYVSKYILKYDKRIVSLLRKIHLDSSLSNDVTDVLTSMIKPRSVMSKDFGDKLYQPINDYILKYLTFYKDNIPQFRDLNTGKMMMLSRYYHSIIPAKFYTERMKYSIYDDSYNVYDDLSILEYRFNSESNKTQLENFERIKLKVWNSFDK